MDKKIIFIYIGILIVSLIVLNAILKRFGLIKSAVEKAKDKKVATLTQTVTGYYQPTFHKGYDSKYFMNSKEAKEIAENLHESMFSTTFKNILSFGTSSLGTDVSKFFANITAIKSKVKFSQVAGVYKSLFKGDLYTDILSELSDDELVKFASYIESLPTT